MADPTVSTSRPLSPHLGIYRFYVTMAASILHRITGAALYVATPFVVWWLSAAASGPSAYAFATGIAASWPGRAVLVAATYGLFLHLLGGIRHFIWDTGHGLGPGRRDALAIASFVGAAGLTAFVWTIALVRNP